MLLITVQLLHMNKSIFKKITMLEFFFYLDTTCKKSAAGLRCGTMSALQMGGSSAGGVRYRKTTFLLLPLHWARCRGFKSRDCHEFFNKNFDSQVDCSSKQADFPINYSSLLFLHDNWKLPSFLLPPQSYGNNSTPHQLFQYLLPSTPKV